MYLNNHNVENMWNIFKCKFKDICDLHAPYVTVRKRSRGSPWITNEYLCIARDRNYFKCKFDKHRTTDYWEKFKEFRNRANVLNKKLKKQYYKNLCIENGNDMKKSWKVLKNLLPKKDANSDHKILVNDQIVVDKEKVAELFNESFNNIQSQLTGANDSHLNINALQTLPQTAHEFKFTEIEECFVLKELLKLDVSKAAGIDDLPPKLLKIAAPHIVRVLTVLFNCSLSKGYVPHDFKVAKITPIHKGGNKMELTNYRPISILPTMSKIFEKAVHNQIYSYLNKHSLLSERQSGFRLQGIQL